MTYAEYLEQQKRNAEKLEAAKQYLGEKWILHPSHYAMPKCQEPRESIRPYKS